MNYIPWLEDRGYEALNGLMSVKEEEKVADVLSPTSEDLNIEKRKLLYMHKFIDDCKSNNIQLEMCYSPYYNQHIPKSIKLIEDLATRNDVLFLNYGEDAHFQKSEYFQDAGHLNDTGAKEYSKEIVRILTKFNQKDA